MKKIAIIAAALAIFTGTLAAQPQGGRQAPQDGNAAKEQKAPDHKKIMEKVQAQKVAYLTSELDLSVEEAEKFWPVYNKLQKKQMEGMTKVRESYKALNDAVKAGAGEAEIVKLINNYEAAQAESKKNCEGSTEAYLKVLPASKVAKLIVSEENFRKQHVGGGHGPQGPGKGHEGMTPGKEFKGQNGSKAGKKTFRGPNVN